VSDTCLRFDSSRRLERVSDTYVAVCG